MTYIEFFDKVASENICACLTYTPDRVVYIGKSKTQIERHIENYRKMFAGRGKTIDFIPETDYQNTLDGAVELLSKLVETYDDCVFDITGGDEILTLALGIVCAKYAEKKIQVHKFNLRNGRAYSCDMDDRTIYHETPALTIEENVQIYGGKVVYEDAGKQRTPRWDMNEEFREDIRTLWNICKIDVRLWNAQINVFEKMEEIGCVSEDGLMTTARMAALKQKLEEDGLKYKYSKRIVSDLRKAGLVVWFDKDDEEITICYKNQQIKKCLTKAGQTLEMKIYLAAMDVRDKEGEPVYHDALNGVFIDWDGQCHDEETENLYDTENEIDVLLMHGMVPVFVSCKNGDLDAAELHKLQVVAERFGGPYARKVLVAPALPFLRKEPYIRQRAKDMGIQVLDDTHVMNDEQLAKRLKTLWSNSN